MHKVVSCVSQAEAEEIDDRVFAAGNCNSARLYSKVQSSIFPPMMLLILLLLYSLINHFTVMLDYLIQSFWNDFCCKSQLAITYRASVILSHSSATSYLLKIYYYVSFKSARSVFGLSLLIFAQSKNSPVIFHTLHFIKIGLQFVIAVSVFTAYGLLGFHGLQSFTTCNQINKLLLLEVI